MTTFVWKPCAEGEPLYTAYCELMDRPAPDSFEDYAALVERIAASWTAWKEHQKGCAGCRVEAVE